MMGIYSFIVTEYTEPSGVEKSTKMLYNRE